MKFIPAREKKALFSPGYSPRGILHHEAEGNPLCSDICITFAMTARFSCHWQVEHIFGLPFPSPGDLPDPGIKPRPTALQADSLPTEL